MDPRFIKLLNNLFHGAEASEYDLRHPEIIKGDRQWWESFSKAYIGVCDKGGPRRLLDVGSGTGFVSNHVSPHLRHGDIAICCDLNMEMLSQARQKLNCDGSRGFRFVCSDAELLPFKSGSFDFVMANSLMHHLPRPGEFLREADRILDQGGLLALSHEPNKAFFKSLVARAAAAIFKLFGLGMKVPDDLARKVNEALRRNGYTGPELNKWELQRLVDYNSPFEDRAVFIDKDKGFSPDELLARYFPKYRKLAYREYSTHYYRRRLSKIPLASQVLRSLALSLGLRGGLFSMVVQKQGKKSAVE